MYTMKIKSEQDLISKIERLIREKGGSVPEDLRKGIGDDCAVYKLDKSRYGLFTADLSIENTHFTREFSSPYDIGYKSMTGNISDIVSMGGVPLLAFVSLGIPGNTEEDFVLELYRGMLDACREPGAVIAGGDTSRSENITVSIALYGECREREPLYRSGASAGDHIYVTGNPGESLAGLKILKSGNRELLEKYRLLVDRHRKPSSRFDLIRDILETYSPTAMIDISDGLLLDLGRLCTESGRGFTLQREKLPVSALLREYCAGNNEDLYEIVLSGGEDYQLLFTSRLSPEEISDKKKGDTVCIGEISGGGYRVETAGIPEEVSLSGYDHFIKRER